MDSTCLVWDRSCGAKGNCWLYDKDSFRIRFFSLLADIDVTEEDDDDSMSEESNDEGMEPQSTTKNTTDSHHPGHTQENSGNQPHTILNFEPVSSLKRKHRTKPGVDVPVTKAIKVTNKFSPLDSGKDNTALEAPTMESSDATHKEEVQAQNKVKTPPIIIPNSAEYNNVIKLLKANLKDEYKLHCTPQGIKVISSSLKDYTTLRKVLKEANLEHFTYMLQRDRPFKVVIKGLHSTMPTESIIAELTEMGFKPINVRQLYTKSTSELATPRPLPIFEPTFYPANYRHLPDVLDLILTDLNQHPEELHTLNELDSDHLPIFCRLLANTNTRTSFLRRKTPITDWSKYKDTLARSTPDEWEVRTTEEVDHSIALLTATLLEARRTSTKYETPLINLKRDHPDLNLLIAQKREARHDWQTSRSPRHRAAYNRLRALVRRRAKQLKMIKWNEFVSETVNGGDNVWAITRRLKCSSQRLKTPAIHGRQGMTYTPEEKAEAIAESLQEQFTANMEPQDEDFSTRIREESPNPAGTSIRLRVMELRRAHCAKPTPGGPEQSPAMHSGGEHKNNPRCNDLQATEHLAIIQFGFQRFITERYSRNRLGGRANFESSSNVAMLKVYDSRVLIKGDLKHDTRVKINAENSGRARKYSHRCSQGLKCRAHSIMYSPRVSKGNEEAQSRTGGVGGGCLEVSKTPPPLFQSASIMPVPAESFPGAYTWLGKYVVPSSLERGQRAALPSMSNNFSCNG
uniref:Nucleic-acid-binding protein from transposon X-element n=1 Tax=Timema douglasi TaxID=61478 RepID=A0A7R8VAM2_TIMDO|nr:unnamed protein product [Timema douglasi]